jgi:transcription factor CRZ1
MNNEFGQPQHMYSGPMQDIPHIRQNGTSIDNQQMVPPQINVEFAPTANRNGFDAPKPSAFDTDALTPPDRGT